MRTFVQPFRAARPAQATVRFETAPGEQAQVDWAHFGTIEHRGRSRPLAEEFNPTWLLISAGFDAHRRDPLTDLGLSAGDYADMTAALAELVPAGKRLAFLEGGYDLQALRDSTTAALSALAGDRQHPEAPTGGGPGRDMVTAAVATHGARRARAVHLGRVL